MADEFEKELSRSEKLLKERLTKAGKIAKDISNKAFRELIESIEDYSSALDDVTDQLTAQLQNYDSIKRSVKDYGDALKSTLPFVRENKDLASKLTQVYISNNKLADKLVNNNEELVTGQLRLKDVAKDIAKSRQSQLNIELAQRDISQEIEQINREMVGLQGQELEDLGFKLEALREINEQLEAEKQNQQAISDNLQEQAESAAKIDAKVGVGGKLLSGLKKIPILGDVLDLDGADEAMRATAASGGGYFKTLGSGIKALGPSLKAALGPLALIQVAADAIKFIVGAMFDANKQSVDLARNIQVTAEGGAKYRQYIIDGKNATETQYKLTSALVQSESELATLSEASLAFSLEQLDVQTQLTKEVKLQSGEAAQLSKLFSINGESSREQLDTVYDSVAEFANQNKILFNSSKVMSAMSKVSGQLLMSFKGNTKELANSVQQAMKLGINLQTAQGISRNMLNFEESISAELEAELITGKNLNLDRARALSLQGKYAEAAEEALNSVGSIEEFQEMNVLQQEALAKAAGVTVDQLSDALIQQKYQGTQTGKQIERFKEMGMEAEAAALAAGKLTGEQLQQATQQLNAQEKFNIAVERAKEIFSDLVDGGAIQTLADAIQGLADSALLKGYAEEGKAKRLTKDLEEDKKGTEEEKAIVKLAENQVSLVDQLKGIAKGAIIGAGAGAAIGGVGAIPGALVGAAVYGFKGSREKRIGQEAAVESEKIREKYYPNEDKEIKANDFTIRTNPEDTLVMAGGTKFGDETNALLKELISSMKSGGNIYIDSTKVGTALGLATYNSNVNFNS